MRYQAELGTRERGKGREKSKAEPRDMRYQAEPVNEEKGNEGRGKRMEKERGRASGYALPGRSC